MNSVLTLDFFGFLFCAENSNVASNRRYQRAESELGQCGNDFYTFNGSAVDTCPDGFFPSTRGQPCQSCSADCATCTAVDACTSCRAGKLLQPDGKCVSTCGPTFMLQDRGQRNRQRVRLSGSRSLLEGRLEVFHGGVHGTVCNTSFSMAAAHVVCKELGFGQAAEILSQTYPASPSSLVFLDKVQCTGDENSILECSHSGWGQHKCYHGQDVAIRCSGPDQRRQCVLACDRGFFSDSVGKVCTPCDLTCRSCSRLGSCSSCPRYAYLNNDDQCVTNCGEGMYGSMETGRCKKCDTACRTCQDGPTNNTCTSCNGKQNLDGDTCIDGCSTRHKTLRRSIRLVGGGTSNYGRLDVLHNGVWGWVCDNGLSFRQEGNVACRSLGLGPYISHISSLQEPRSLGMKGPSRVWLSNLTCSGRESNLFQCRSSWPGSTPLSCGDQLAVDVWLRCKHPLQVTNQPRCVDHCPATFFSNGTQCEHCHYSCETCAGNWKRCTSCGRGRFLTGSHCSKHCPEGFFGNTTSRICSPCSPNCKRCKPGKPKDICTLCLPGYFLYNTECVAACPRGTALHNGRCYHTCPTRRYRQESQCLPCPRHCAKCMPTPRSTNVQCSACQPGFALNRGSCAFACPRGYFKSPAVHTAGLGVRLVGSSPNAGRLEVLHSGVWGTVCKDKWNSQNSLTVCQSLGYSHGNTKSSSDLPGYLVSRDNQPIWMDDVQCNPHHPSLSMCRHPGWGVHDCSHQEDVYLSCYSERHGSCVSSCPAGTHGRSGQCKRCAGQCADCQGAKLECRRCNSGFYLLNQTCRTICPAGYIADKSSGRCAPCDSTCAACISTTTLCSACKPGFYLKDNRCLTDCGKEFSTEKYPHARLEGGPSDSEGYVVISTPWSGFGHVCNDYWSLADGHVLCRQLGLGQASRVYVSLSRSIDTRSVHYFYDSIRCFNNETGCRVVHKGSSKCFNNEFAGVKCTQSAPILKCKPSCNTSDGFFIDGNACLYCDTSCKTCSGNRKNCTSCYKHMYRLGSACLRECPGDYFTDSSSGECVPCHESCRTCSGPFPSNCTDCKEISGKIVFLKDSTCVSTCSGPNHYIHTLSLPWRHQVRLVQHVGIPNTTGRIEVLDPKTGKFGTVCGDFFDWREARVICRQLGLGEPVTIFKRHNLSQAYSNWNLNLLTILDDLRCRGDEPSLLDCNHNGIGVHDCSEMDSAGVMCGPQPAKHCSTGCGNGYVVTGRSPPTCMQCSWPCEACNDASTCTRCKPPFVLQDGKCSHTCHGSFFGNTVTGVCEKCSDNCLRCLRGPRNDSCDLCNPSEKPYRHGLACVESCPLGTAPLNRPFSLDRSRVQLNELSIKVEGKMSLVCGPLASSVGVVACRHHGLEFSRFIPAGRHSLKRAIDNLHCTGREESLLNCSVKVYEYSTNAIHCKTERVVCKANSSLTVKARSRQCTRVFPSTRCHDNLCDPNSGCFNSASGGSACWACPSPFVGDGQNCVSKYRVS